ncbi:hypothetical protein ACQ4PT_018844 [Festuca glaucescens]
MASSSVRAPRIVLLPSAGMGHLAPFGRLAATLSSSDHACDVSLVTFLPTISSAESAHLDSLFAALPAVRRIDVRLPPLDTSSDFSGTDPFYAHYEATRRATPLLLPPLLATSSADISLASIAIPLARELHLPCYVFFTASATMFSFYAYFPTYLDAAGNGDADIPGVGRVPRSSFPQALHDRTNLFRQQFLANGWSLPRADGLLVNTFDALEPEAVAALRSGTVVPRLPPVFTVGPLIPVSFLTAREPSTRGAPADYTAWLDAQPERSVVYVSFGSRKALAPEQLETTAWISGSCSVKVSVQGRGMVTKAWVEQGDVLKHPAVGMFLSHCGWNSLTEVVASGVPVLAWPRFADQRVNAGVVARAGAGAWVEAWSWEGEEGVVKAEEIAETVRSVMADETLRIKAATVRDATARALAGGGTSYRSLAKLVRRCAIVFSGSSHEHLQEQSTDAE